MAGFGRRLLAGLAGGASNYFGEKYKAQEEDRKSAALLLRETALAEAKSRLTREETVQRGAVERDTYRDKRTADADYEVAVTPTKVAAEVTVAERKGTIEARNKAKALELTHGYAMSEIGERARVDAIAAATAANQEVDRFQVARDGSGVFYNKKGVKIAQTPPGAFDRPNEKKAGSGSTILEGLDEAPATAAPPAKKPSSNEDWRAYEETAKNLLGEDASPAEVQAKARELAKKYGG